MGRIRPKLDAQPFSLKLPPEMRLWLDREGAKRGGMPVGVLLREIVASYIDRQRRSRAKKKPDATEQPPAT